MTLGGALRRPHEEQAVETERCIGKGSKESEEEEPAEEEAKEEGAPKKDAEAAQEEEEPEEEGPWVFSGGALAVTLWFTVGGLFDLRFLFRRLGQHVPDPTDDGRVVRGREL